MLNYHDDPDTVVWEIPVADLPVVPTNLPSQWANAIRRVSDDLTVRRTAHPVDVDGLIWDLEFSSTDTVAIGMHSASPGHFSTFLISNDFSRTSSTEQCTAWVAQTLQDHLAGYEYVLWPSATDGTYSPAVLDDHAVWTAPTSQVVARIGELRAL